MEKINQYTGQANKIGLGLFTVFGKIIFVCLLFPIGLLIAFILGLFGNDVDEFIEKHQK